MLSLLASKALVLGVMFVMTFGLRLIPIRLMTVIQRNATVTVTVTNISVGSCSRRFTYKHVLSFLSCFAAGVFLATCFLDLLPGVRKDLMTVLFEKNITSGFPLAEFIMSVGLFVILIVEQIVLLTKEKRTSDSDVREPLLGKVSEGRDTEAPTDQDDKEEFLQSDHSITGISDQPAVDSVLSDGVRPMENSVMSTNRQKSDSSHSHHHHHHHHHGDLQTHSPLRAMMMLMALSLHSIFEGLAVGLQASAGQVLGIFAALVLHKSILSFSIGMNLVQSRLSTKKLYQVDSVFLLNITCGCGSGNSDHRHWGIQHVQPG